MTDRYLITTQSYRHEYATGADVPTQYGYLVETDFHGDMRLLRIPTPTDAQHGERIKPGLRGMAAWDGRLYVASWNTVYIVDYPALEIVDSFSHPLMADLHGLHVDADGLWVTSSLIDSLLHFDHQRNLRGMLAISETPLYPPHLRKAVDRGADYRLRGKEHAGFAHFHANHVTGCNDRYVLVTGRGDGEDLGHVLLVDRATLDYRVWFKGLLGPHDGEFVAPGILALTETNGSSVALLRPPRLLPPGLLFRLAGSGRIGRRVRAWLGPRLARRITLPVGEEKYWTRGLCRSQRGTLLVGKSVWKGSQRQASVLELSLDSAPSAGPVGALVAEYILAIDDYPECRIFQIMLSPEGAS